MGTTLNFGPRMTKIALDFIFPKILMVIEDFWVRARIYRETAFFPEKMGKKSDFWPKINFCGSNPNCVTFHLILLQKLTFFILCTLLSKVKNKASPKCPYPKSALSGAFWPKTRFFAQVMILSCLNNIHNLLTIQVTNQDNIQDTALYIQRTQTEYDLWYLSFRWHPPPL